MNTEENISIDYEQIESLLALRHSLNTYQQSKAHTNFLSFVRLMAPTLVSDWEMGKHIEVISDKLQQIQDVDLKRLMVFLPPRSSKSVICSN